MQEEKTGEGFVGKTILCFVFHQTFHSLFEQFSLAHLSFLCFLQISIYILIF